MTEDELNDRQLGLDHWSNDCGCDWPQQELLDEVRRLRDAIEVAWYCLTWVGPLNEYEQWARDVLVQALGGTPPSREGPMVRPYDVARRFIGDDYPYEGWEDGIRGAERTP